ncbi:hypothetical protein Shyd_93670 [Streptomyces hydrogenans]|uniref:RNA polymerase sigma factor n=1 Tax=Streptomyces hydrogenans TaxID=1873719 RepID=A0ABQ3PSK3_9ACTN|nr:hypothetical protein Shyd_93670 [Streptomyces hydrogenans]
MWDAEDLAQEALARAFTRAAQTHQPVERPMAWLVRIATNAYLDQVRRPAPLLVERQSKPLLPPPIPPRYAMRSRR